MIDVPVEVKEALKNGSLKKNYRFLVLNDDESTDFVIDNNNLVKESVDFDERMNSGDKIKFGLCEGASLEFQYFGLPNINGRRLKALCDVQYAEQEGYVKIAEVTAPSSNSYTVEEEGSYILYISTSEMQKVDYVLYYDSLADISIECNIDVMSDGHGEVNLYCYVHDAIYYYSKNNVASTADVLHYYSPIYTIPMGFYTVHRCPRQASTGIYKITAYSKLMSDYLDAKADDLIKALQSDTQNVDSITLATIQSMLLEDFQIEEKQIVTVKGGVGTTGGYTSNTPTFKVNGSTTTYKPHIKTQLLTFWHLDPSKRYRIKMDTYIEKLNACIESMKASIMANVQNANTFWNSFVNDSAYQALCGITVIFGDGNVENASYTIKAETVTTPDATLPTHGYVEDLEYLYGVSHISFMFPQEFSGFKSAGVYYDIWFTTMSTSLDDMVVEEMDTDSIETIEISKSYLEDVTLRELASANYELHCFYGKLDRETDLFSGVALNESRLYPRDTLYPANDLYPGGGHLSGSKAMYSKLWADEGNIHKWKYLIITYKGLDDQGNEVEKKLQRTVNADGTDNYNMSDNWLFKNLVWAAEDVGDYADAMVEKMRGMSWFPFEMWCAGLPYIETGDEIEISLGETTYSSYVLQRQLKGIQNLQDTYINGTLDIF